MEMIDTFALLAPLFLLGVVALLGFVGCDRVFGLTQVDPPAIEPSDVIPAFGPSAGGTSVQIRGTSLAGVDQLTFGGIDATSFSVIGDTEIDAVTPANPAGPVNVVLTRTADSVSNTNQLVFTYIAIGFVQTQSFEQTAKPPISVTLNNTTAGNLLIAAVSYGGPAVGSVTVSDNLGNAFTLAGIGPWFRQSRIFYLPKIPGGAVTITATGAGGAVGPCSMCVSEYSGPDATSAAVYGFSSVASPGAGTAGLEVMQGVAVTPTESGDVVYVVVFAAQATNLVAGPGFVLRPSLTSTVLVEDGTNAVTAAQTVASVDTSGGNFMQWVILAVAIKA
jgi:hypothetical protein